MEERALTVKRRSTWWGRWVIAGLLVSGVYATHVLPQRVRDHVLTVERQWVTSTWHIPKNVGLRLPIPSTRHAVRPLTHQVWAHPVSQAHLVESFGWHHQQFDAQVTLQTTPGQVVQGFARATVIRTAPSLELSVGKILVVLQGVQHMAVHRGQKVSLGTVLGRVGRHLAIAVQIDGLPVNPLLPQYFGTTWARP